MTLGKGQDFLYELLEGGAKDHFYRAQWKKGWNTNHFGTGDGKKFYEVGTLRIFGKGNVRLA